ncbi:hypothetical protein B0A55_02606 [Friedmanniomyces simplex]|uniref:Fe2OG dioxygenase domain-containing protein n=1 Tax=Friedmanniomyces simplex TaxID=329884 RepID=A0A4U0XMM7_9PEZI|nr:hypothetical protein B0A55_02606 [Friedmanniomyces simplex]
MASLLALLSQQGATLQTRKGLILLGLQNDFLSPEGKLPVSTKSGFLDRLKQLVPSFRDFGDVIWVRSEFEANREPHDIDDTGDTVIAGAFAAADDGNSIKEGSKRRAGYDTSAPMKRMKATDVEDDDPELFLKRTSTREPCCLRGSWGADHPPDVEALVNKTRDMQVVKSHYSAFGSGGLLSTLRSKLITELFVCGCNTNLSVFATAMDAARHGIKITLIEDCLGFRKKERHDEAIRQLVEIMAADVLTGEKVIDVLKSPPEYDDDEEEEEEDEFDDEEHAAQNLAQLNVSYRPYRHESIEAPPGLDMAAILDVDSDEDEEEDMVFAPVRSPLAPSARLALRYTSTRRTHSRPLAADPELAPQRAEPAHPHVPEAGALRADDGVATGVAESEGVRDSGADGVEPEVELAGYGGGVEQDGGEGESDANVDLHVVIPATDKPEPSAPAREGAPATLSEVNDSSQNGDDSNKPSSPEVSEPAAAETTISNTQPTLGVQQLPSSEEAHIESTDKLPKTMQEHPLFGEDKEVESAGSRILCNLLPAELAETVFTRLNAEVEWQRMHHQTGEVPRLVCCQGTIAEDGSKPVYRHPSDETLSLHPWSPTVETVRKAAEQAVGHPLNHALIQLYRGGTDYISEHSDKTLDIMKGSSIVNVSFGAQRTMRLRTKRGVTVITLPADGSSSTGQASSSPPTPPPRPPPPRTTYRVDLPHNSMLTLSLRTNAEYLHSINADKRPAVELTEAEKAYEGQRISLTFRHIATFLDAEGERIWGQGAVGKTQREARPVVSGDAAESEGLVRAFGAENAASGIEWEVVYGRGSDVLHLRPKKDGLSTEG